MASTQLFFAECTTRSAHPGYALEMNGETPQPETIDRMIRAPSCDVSPFACSRAGCGSGEAVGDRFRHTSGLRQFPETAPSRDGGERGRSDSFREIRRVVRRKSGSEGTSELQRVVK